MSNSYPLLRLLTKLPTTNSVKLPKISDFPSGFTWGAFSEPPEGFERFLNPHVRSMLTLPSKWHSYEFDQEMGVGIKARNLLSSREDARTRGYFDTGVTITLIGNIKTDLAEQMADALRCNTLKMMTKKLGGSEDWMEYGETAKICSLRYCATLPEVKFHTGQTAPSKKMIFIQDLFFEEKTSLIFRMKFEAPEELFNEATNEFEIIKTGSYFMLDNQGANGLAFLSL